MIIRNCNLRRQLGRGRLLQIDGGAGTGSAGGEGNPKDSGDSEGNKDGEPKTFTQEELDNIVKERVARSKKGQPSKEDLEAFNTWKESQKTEEKQSDALTNAEKARFAAEEKATALEAKLTCLSKGVNVTSVDDVVVLAKAMVSEELIMEQAIDKVLEKYPSFKGEEQKQEKHMGFKIGADGQKQKENPNDVLSRAFGNK